MPLPVASLQELVSRAREWHGSRGALTRALLATAGGVAFLAGVFAFIYVAATYEGPISREDVARFRLLFAAAADEDEPGAACAALTEFLQAHPEVAAKARYVRSALRAEDELSAETERRVEAGDYQGALRACRRRLTLVEEFNADWAARALFGYELGAAWVRVEMGRIHLLMGDTESAEAAFGEALAGATDAPTDRFVKWEIEAVRTNPRDPPSAADLYLEDLKRGLGASPRSP